MKVTLACQSEADTMAAGRRLAGLLRPGDIVLLAGGLGAGKTLFTAGLAEGLGVGERVTSPTFVLARSYHDGFLPLVHADVYRLTTAAEFDDLELVDLARDGVLVVEWGHAVAAAVPPAHLLVEFEVTGDRHRSISFLPRGGWSRSLEELSA